MKIPKKPANERLRLKRLRSLDILESDQSNRLDQLVKLASMIAQTPISLISLIDENKQWFKSKFGLEATETPRDISFCGHAINLENEIFEIPDATKDERFYDNPLVTDNPNIRFYAGKPLTTSDGYNIGTLCVIDNKPNKLTEEQKHQLSIIAQEIIYCIEDQKEIETLKDDVNTKAAFVSSMSHELRTPLTSVIGFIDVLKDQVESESFNKREALNTLATLKSNSEHLVNLIGDILDFSKLEAKKFLINRETFLLSKALKQVYNTLNMQAKKFDVEFSLDQSMSTPEYVYGDITLLKQVLINLGSNAIKFASGETVKIKVESLEKDKLISFDIIDTGVGMSPKEASKIFRPFSQANEKIASKFDGTGLGLAISKEIVDLLGGTIDLIKTEKGVGSHFRVNLPFVEKLESDLISPINEDSAKKIDFNLEGKKFLVVDDIKENRFLVRHYLKDFDIEVRDAATGKEALEKLDESFDYIFLDMQLPDSNGLEIYERLKPQLKEHQKIIAFTASSTKTGIEECLQAGFSGYLAKPFDTESILNSLSTNQKNSKY